MKAAEFLWDEFIYGGHWFAINMSSIVLSVMILFNMEIRLELLLISYLIIQCIFSYNHYKEIDSDEKYPNERVGYLKKYQRYLPLISILYGFSFISLLLIYGEFSHILLALLLFVLGMLFTVFFKSFTKKIIGFKTYYTAFIMSIFVVLFTAVYCSYSINVSLIKFCVYLAIHFFIGTSYSDIKDIESDKTRNLITLPIYFGKEKFLTVLHLLNVISMLVLFFTVIEINIAFILFVIFNFFYVAYFIEKSKNENENIQRITNILVDGEFISWPFFIIVGLILLNI